MYNELLHIDGTNRAIVAEVVKCEPELFLGPQILLHKLLDRLNVLLKSACWLKLQCGHHFGRKARPISPLQVVQNLVALHFHLLRLHFVDCWIVIDDFAVNLHEHGLLERNLFRKLLPLVRALGWYITQQTASVMQNCCLATLLLPLGFHHGRARIRLCAISGPSRLRLDVFIIPLHESLSPRPSHRGRLGLIVRGLGICDLFRRVQNGDLRWWHRISAAKNFSGLSSWDRLQLQDGWREGGDRLSSLIEDWLFSEVVPLLVAVALLKLPIRFNFVFLELREL